MEFRLVAYWTASCASATVSIIHISVTNCVPIWIGSQRNSRAKKGRVFQRALSGSHSISRST